jgi:hypothetical protein
MRYPPVGAARNPVFAAAAGANFGGVNHLVARPGMVILDWGHRVRPFTLFVLCTGGVPFR